MLHSCLGVIDKNARIDAAESALALKQECQILSVGLRLNLEEARQALFIK
jgi:hypothetical protein